MKFLIAIIISLFIFSCNKNPHPKLSLPITLLIIPEDYDSTYSITWTDTLGQSENYTTLNRPFELCCDIMARKDTVGYYHGLSMPRNFTYFTTSDSIIEIYFELMPNGSSENLTKDLFNEYINVKPFQPIQINIKKDLRKELKFTLTEK